MSEYMLQHATAYAKTGWHVFPLLPGTKVPYRGSNGVKDATANVGRIRDWWGQTPNASIGLATGRESAVFALDVDPRHGGHETLKALEATHGALPATIESATGGGGRHFLFRHPGGRVGNSAGKLGKGLDIKADGGYIVLPPSVHPSGVLYEWVHAPGSMPLADAPPWLLEMLDIQTDADCDRESGRDSVLSVLSVTTVVDLLRLTLPTDMGQRRNRLFTFARGLKAIPEYADAEPLILKPVVKRWWVAALPYIRTKEFDETWQDFVDAWSLVKIPLGAGPMVDALERAKAAPLPDCAEQYDSDAARLLVKLCVELQRLAVDEPFYLSARIAGDALGVDRMKAHRCLKMLVADGLLTVVERGTKTRATRYRLNEPTTEE